MSQTDKINLKKVVEDIKLNVELFRAEGYTDNFKLELAYLEKYPEQYDKFPFLIKKIIKKEDLEVLDKMLESVDKINEGTNKFEEEKKLGKILEKKYISK